jgi:hypothetical protein
VALLVLLAAAGAIWPLRALYYGPQRVLREFWAPVFASQKQVIIYAGANAVYRFSDEFLDKYRKEHHIEQSGPQIFVNLPPNQKIEAGDLIPVGDASVDGQACAQLVSLITRLHGTYALRYGSDISIGDLEDSPTILVGAFNNPWTLRMTSSLRFVFRGGNRIEDTWHKLPGWSEEILPNGEMTDDYAVVTRLLDPQSGHMLVTAAGIGSFGTQAAAEFLSSASEMAQLAQEAPPGWQKKNLQIVLHETLRNGMLADQNIVAVQAW